MPNILYISYHAYFKEMDFKIDFFELQVTPHPDVLRQMKQKQKLPPTTVKDKVSLILDYSWLIK